MGHADKLNFVDLLIASVRNTHGTEWRLDQLQSLLNHVGRLVDDLSKSSNDIEDLDVLGDLVDQAAIQCELCGACEPTAADIAADRGEAKFEQKRDAALVGS
ncbi:MAG: hypothetical protein ACM3VZ_10270 [Acidobacteriota bacterium]